jgi:Tfp pilus assembly protein PilW
MTTSTPPTDRTTLRPRARCAGFTLTEVIVAATISTFVLAGVLAAFLMIGRSGYAASHYSEMESQVRNALEIFGTDVRKATDIRWNSSQSITLSVVTAGSATTAVTYAYDDDATSPGFRSFYRLVGPAGATAPRLALVREVGSDFRFQRFKLEQAGVTDNTAANDLETKQLEVTLRTARNGATTVATTQSAVSARYILRNKRVSN